MKKTIIGLMALAFTTGVQAQAKAKPAAKATASATVLKTNQDSLSYAFGISLGSYMKSQGLSVVNYTLLNKAIQQTLKGEKTALDVNAANQVMAKLGEAKSKKVAAAEKEKGKVFLAANKKKSGIKETASGLQYEILKAGDGPMPKLTDTIVAHYKGTLIDGKEFDNSYTRGEPITIPVSGVIPGWTEALQLMPVGSKWKLYIPSSSGYGDYGAGQDIPGGATLVFEVELISIKQKS